MTNDLTPEEYAILEREDEGPNGNYATPRICPCGQLHFSRDLYWAHRLDSENLVEASK